MPAPFAGPVGVPADDHHADGGDGVRNRAQQSRRQVRPAGSVAHDLRQPESHRVKRNGNREIHTGEKPYASARQRAADTVDTRGRRGFVGPNIIGYVQQTTRGFTGGLIAIGIVLAGGGLLVLAVNTPKEPFV